MATGCHQRKFKTAVAVGAGAVAAVQQHFHVGGTFFTSLLLAIAVGIKKHPALDRAAAGTAAHAAHAGHLVGAATAAIPAQVQIGRFVVAAKALRPAQRGLQGCGTRLVQAYQHPGVPAAPQVFLGIQSARQALAGVQTPALRGVAQVGRKAQRGAKPGAQLCASRGVAAGVAAALIARITQRGAELGLAGFVAAPATQPVLFPLDFLAGGGVAAQHDLFVAAHCHTET